MAEETTAIVSQSLTGENLDLLKRTICRGATDDEFKLFVYVCKRTGLDPFVRQIHAVKRWQDGREQMTIQTGIDGYRLIAERTGKYMPGRETVFEYDDKGKIVKATAYVKKMDSAGAWHEISATAHFAEYCNYKKDGSMMQMWRTKGHIMLQKCAESACLRKAFPVELSGLYTAEEMDHAGPIVGTEVIDQDAEPVEQDAKPKDLSDDPMFFAAWDKVATDKGIAPKIGRDFLNALMGKEIHRAQCHTVEWRQGALDAFAEGKFDAKFAKAAPKVEPVAADASKDEKLAAAKAILDQAQSREQAGKDLDSVTDGPTEEEVASHDDFIAMLIDIPSIAESYDIDKLNAALAILAKGKEIVSLSVEKRIAIIKAAKSGKFTKLVEQQKAK
jgi:phage recombination protein Bet